MNQNQVSQPLIFDLEADGFYDDVTRIWCITVFEDGQEYHYGPDEIDLGVNHLHGQHVCAHNAINYDIRVLKKFYPWFQPAKIDDTFVLSSLFEPDRPGHGLADWGIQFGIPKPVHEDWTQYSEAMKHRNIEDVRITERVYHHLLKERNSWDWEPAIRLEYKIAMIHAEQESNGVAFDLEAANKLADKIEAEITEIDNRILTEVPPKWVKDGEPILKPYKLNGELNERTLKWIQASYPDHFAKLHPSNST